MEAKHPAGPPRARGVRDSPPRNEMIRPWMRPLALVLALALAFAGMRGFESADTIRGWFPIALASALAAFALGPRAAGPGRAGANADVRWRGRLWIALGFILFGLGAALCAGVLYVSITRPYWLPTPFAWMAGLGLMLLGLSLTQAEQLGTGRSGRASVLLEVAVLLALVAVAIALRVYRLETLPPGMFVDETNASIDALYILDGRQVSAFTTGWYEVPNLYMYFLAALFKLFGPTFYTLKAASLIPAVLTVVAIYPLARILFGIPTAVVATLLMSVARWHLILSRWGWVELIPPLIMILVALMLTRASRSNRLFEYALGGVLLGIGMYSYLAIRLMVIAVALYLLYRILFERGYLKRAFAGLAVFTVVYALTFGPLAVAYVQNPVTFLNRSSEVNIFNDINRAGSVQPLAQSTQLHAEMFTVRGDRNGRHNLPGEPMLDPVTGILFLLALGGALWHLADHRYTLLLVWVIGALAGGILSNLAEAPQAFRTLTALPAAVILAADFLVRALRALNAWFVPAALARGRLAWAPATLAGVTLVGFAGYQNIDSFFNRYASNRSVSVSFNAAENAMAREAAQRRPVADVYLSDAAYYFSTTRFLNYVPKSDTLGSLEKPDYGLFDPGANATLPSNGRDAFLLLDNSNGWVSDLIARYYPNAKTEQVKSAFGDPLHFRIAIPAGDLAALQGLNGVYGDVKRHDPRLSLTFPADLPPGAAPPTVVWEGSIRIPRSGPLNLRGAGDMSIEFNQAPFTQGQFVGVGLYSIRLTLADPARAGRIGLFWKLAGDRVESETPVTNLFAIQPGNAGLVARYYRTEDWSGPVVFSQTVNMVMIGWNVDEPWPAAFSASFAGKITAPVNGAYLFYVNADDGARLWIDGQVVGEALAPDRPNTFEARVSLTPGPHDIRLDYFQRGGSKRVELWWQPPNGTRQPVPPGALSH
jgi:4-amino-4-deoxy-L-arabinose transferase-like glycosyltransferase